MCVQHDVGAVREQSPDLKGRDAPVESSGASVLRRRVGKLSSDSTDPSMYRGPSTSGAGGLYAAERLEALKRTAAGYSRKSKPYQLFQVAFRRNGWLCGLLATFILCGAIMTVGLMDMSIVYRTVLPQARQQYHRELGMLIKEAEFERSELIVEMFSVYELVKEMRASIEDKAKKRREQQAEYDRVSEIHRGRLESSSVDATDAATRKEWDAELDTALAALDEVVGQHNYATWAEYSKYERLQKLRHEITALTLAIDDMTKERSGQGRPSGLLKGHPAKLLKSSRVKPSGAVFDRTKLRDMYKTEMQWAKMPDGYITEDGQRDLRKYVQETTKDWESHAQKLTSAREAARQGREPLSLMAEDRTEAKFSTSELMRRLLAVHTLRESREALGETGDIHGDGEGVEGLEDAHVKSGGRALAANVLWLDANPDAKQELAQASPGAGAIASLGRRPVPFAEDTTLASKILAGTRGNAGQLTDQDGAGGGVSSGGDSEAARHRARRDAAPGQAEAAGGQEGEQATAQVAAVSVAGKVAAGKLSGESARHRAHRASLMGASVKQQQPAVQGKKQNGRAADAASSADALDESVRCRMSSICEGSLACKPGSDEVLGCITNSTERQDKVKDAMLWSWKGYRDYAWGEDELKPLSKQSGMWFNLGLTLVDSLDTLLIMGLRDEFLEARNWVESSLAVNPDVDVNLFETTIRVLGGLLASFHLSAGDQMLLYKAADLGMRLSAAFQSQTGIPFSDVNLQTQNVHQPPWTQFSSLSEVSTLSMEFTYLERAAGEPAGGQPSIDVVEKLMKTEGRTDGLAPFYVDPSSGALGGGVVTLGARGDSYYEYMLKQWLLSGKQQQSFLRGYKESMQGVRRRLLQRTAKEGGLLYVAELHGTALVRKMDHLVCFLPGLLALGHMHGVNTGKSGEPDDLAIAKDLMQTCYEMYARTPSGLAPEIAYFVERDGSEFPKQHEHDVGGGDFTVKPQDAHNLLRPESMESLFVMWRVTGDAMYREWGWLMFRAWEKFSRVSTGGYTNLDSVLQVPPPQRDKMESFWPAETLKYLYLLLDESQPELLPLDQFVFNTEAHPLPIIGSMADAEAAKWYVKGPRNNSTRLAAPAQSIEERAQDWGSALSAIGNANAYKAWNATRNERSMKLREALLRAALTGEPSSVTVAFH